MKKAEKDYKKQMDVSIKKHRKVFRLLTKFSSISGSTVAPSPSFVGF
jgi:hypothetical protein